MTGAGYWATLGPVLLGLTVVLIFLGTFWLLRRRASLRRGRENVDEPQRGGVTGGHLEGEPPQVNRRD